MNGLSTPPDDNHGPCISCNDAYNMQTGGTTATCGTRHCRLVEKLKAEIADCMTREEAADDEATQRNREITRLNATITRLTNELAARRVRHTTRVSILLLYHVLC